MRKLTLLKTVLFIIVTATSILNLRAQTNIIPIRTDVSGFTDWTDSGVAGTTYLQLLTATSSTITPAMNFNTFTGETLNFKARTYGGATAVENEVFVAISVDNGSTWTDISSRTPASNTLTAVTAYDLSSYTGTQVKVKFYVKGTSATVGAGLDDITFTGVAGPTCTASNIAFANPTVTKITGDANFTQTPTSLSSGAITYSSSATNVATIDPSTGEVSVKGIGSTTITATQATVSPYCGSTATYTLNVTAAPTLTVTDVTAPVLVSTDGSQVSQTINVSAVNLTNDLGLALTGPNANLFTLSQYSVTQTAGSVPNTAITITYKPIIGTNHSATLTMASTGAFDLSRSIIGQNNGPTTVIPVLSLLNVTVYNGKINFTANEGESLDIYSSVGQRLLHKLTNDGINTISAPANGVLIVKVGNRVGKVIL
jgi:trimeric autotransporter adhesin